MGRYVTYFAYLKEAHCTIDAEGEGNEQTSDLSAPSRVSSIALVKEWNIELPYR